MALNAYLSLTGKTQGDIKGSVTQKAREGKIMIIATSHEVLSPMDAASGNPTGKRMHLPYSVTKEVDKSSPLLFNLLVNNEQITKWTLEFWRPSQTGQEHQYFTVELGNAHVASIKQVMPNNKHPELMRLETYEEVAFTYQKITWT